MTDAVGAGSSWFRRSILSGCYSKSTIVKREVSSTILIMRIRHCQDATRGTGPLHSPRRSRGPRVRYGHHLSRRLHSGPGRECAAPRLDGQLWRRGALVTLRVRHWGATTSAGQSDIKRSWWQILGGHVAHDNAALAEFESLTARTKSAVLETLNKAYDQASVAETDDKYGPYREDGIYRGWKTVAPDDPQAQRHSLYFSCHARGASIYRARSMSWRAYGTFCSIHVPVRERVVAYEEQSVDLTTRATSTRREH